MEPYAVSCQRLLSCYGLIPGAQGVGFIVL